MCNLVSIVVPIYNVEQYLNKCINSIVNQTYKKLEIILIDDGSLDSCPRICDEWKGKDERIKVVHKKNGGLSDARNIGINISNGKYIFFVDSDDWIEKNTVEIMLETLEKNNADICCAGIFCEYPDKTIINNVEHLNGDSELFYKKLYDNTKYPVSAWNKLYKKELWNKLSFPVGKLCEDAFTTYQLIDKAHKIIQIETPLYHYNIRANSIMTTEFNKKRMDEEEAWRMNYKFIEKNYPHLKRIAYDFYLQKVYTLIKYIPQSKRNDEFKSEYKFLKKILKENYIYIILKSGINLKFKIKFAVCFLLL